AVDRLDPGGTPGIDRRVIEPDGRAMEGKRRPALARPPPAGNDPDVLDGAAAQHPAEVQLAAHRRGPSVTAGASPLQIPGTDEAPEEHELACVLGGRAGDVQRSYQPDPRLRRIHSAGHWLSSSFARSSLMRGHRTTSGANTCLPPNLLSVTRLG